jgi:hypothetical protein
MIWARPARIDREREQGRPQRNLVLFDRKIGR